MSTLSGSPKERSLHLGRNARSAKGEIQSALCGSPEERSFPFVRQGGFSLIEIMVGLLIGLIATAVILQTFAVSEGFKRSTTSAGDAQQTGLFSTFTLGLELANAGNGMALSGRDLVTCANTPPYNTYKTTLRPIPVFIIGDNNDDLPDAVAVNYSVTNTIVFPAPFVAAAAAGAGYQVQSPTGFVKDDMIVAISKSGPCAVTKVSSVSKPDANGVVTITHSGAKQNFSGSSVLFNMGQWNRVQRVQYDLSNGVLRSLDLVDAAAVPNPLSSNIVNMKVQYGIDDVGDGLLHTWVKGSDKGWTPADLLVATLPQLNRIKAVRIGMIVRSAQYDREIATDYNWVLFDCDDANKKTCPSRLTGTINADPGGGGYRYRTYETVVPLRNNLWNKEL